MTLGQIIEKSNRPRTETILHIVLKFQFDRACFQSEEASVNFGVRKNIAYASATRAKVPYVLGALTSGNSAFNRPTGGLLV